MAGDTEILLPAKAFTISITLHLEQPFVKVLFQSSPELQSSNFDCAIANKLLN
jgi:hypothetical protein